MEMANQYPESGGGRVVGGCADIFGSLTMADLKSVVNHTPKYLEQEEVSPHEWFIQVAGDIDRLEQGRLSQERWICSLISWVRVRRETRVYHAAATCDAEPAARQVKQPTLVIATHSSLRDGTLQAQNAEWLPQATLVERDDITMPAFELGADALATLARDFVT